jgi:hypothetical protein
MTASDFKRSAADFLMGFQRPHHECFACNDTGILHDSDGLLSQRLPLYDRLADGRRTAGSDLALICHCPAAFPLYAGEKTARGGFRQSSGEIHRLEDGRSIGAETPEALMRDLHAHRLAGWLATERAMEEARERRQSGQREARPWFLAELRTLVEEQARQRAAVGAQAAGGFSSIGDCLAAALAGPGGGPGGCPVAAEKGQLGPERSPDLSGEEVAAQKAELQMVLQGAQQAAQSAQGA